jgi:transposase-like protein
MTPEIEKHILSLFEKGNSVSQISKISNISKSAIYNCLRKKGIKFNTKIVMTSEIKKQVLSLLEKGNTVPQTAKILNINKVTIGTWLHTQGIKLNPNKGNVHYFQTINSYAKAYIVGFIAADGSLVTSKHGSPALTITLKYEDKAVLEFIKSEIGNEHELHEIKRACSYDKSKQIHHIRYCITDKNIAQDLINLGITPNKSTTMQNIINNIPYEFRDAFIIGYFDGDGSVSLNNQVIHKKGKEYPSHTIHVQLRGTKEFFKGVCDHLNITYNHIHQYDSIPQLSFASKKDICRFFKCYNNLPFYYKRKHDVFLKRIYHPSFDKYRQVQTISSLN